MNLTRALMLILLAASLTACAGMRPAPPEVQLSGLEITDVSLSHANFFAKLRLYNPNGVAVDIRGIEFSLFLNDVRVADGRATKPLSIPAEEYVETTLRLSSSFLNLFQLSRKLQDQEQIAFRIDGEVTVGGLGILRTTVPIQREGVLPLVGTLHQLQTAPR